MPSSDMDGRIILVTGASRGIGRAAAIEVARRGAQVIAIARTQGALEELDDEITKAGGRITMIVADLTNREMMAKLPTALGDRFGHLDGFLANAGTLGDLTPVADTQLKMWDGALALNVTANVQLLAGLDPLLRKGTAPRVVGVTSGGARRFRPFWATYSASKAALEAVFLTYALEVTETPIRVNLVNPGPIRTRMRAKAMPGEDPETLPAPEDLAPLIADMLGAGETRHGEIADFREWKEKDGGGA